MIRKDIEESSKKGMNRSPAAKWMPRKGKIAKRLETQWEMTPKKYRKFLVSNTHVVETFMCGNQWDMISFEEGRRWQWRDIPRHLQSMQKNSSINTKMT